MIILACRRGIADGPVGSSNTVTVGIQQLSLERRGMKAMQ